MSRLIAAIFAVVTAVAQTESEITTINTQLPATSTKGTLRTASASDGTSPAPTTFKTSDVLLSLAESLLSGYEYTSLSPLPSAIVIDSSTFAVTSGSIVTSPPATSPTFASTGKTDMRTASTREISSASAHSTPSGMASGQTSDLDAAIIIGVTIGGLALALLGVVGFFAHRRKRRTGTYFRDRPRSDATEKDPEMWHPLKHEVTAVPSPATLPDEWADGCTNTRDEGFAGDGAPRVGLLPSPTPLRSARLPPTRLDSRQPSGLGPEADVFPLPGVDSSMPSPGHELDSRPLPSLPTQRAASPHELQGDAIFPIELSPHGRSSSTVEDAMASPPDQQQQGHRPVSWTSLMRPQRFSSPAAVKRQRSGALDSGKPLVMMGFGGGNRTDMPSRPVSCKAQFCYPSQESEISKIQESPTLGGESRLPSEANTPSARRRLAFEQIQQRVLARQPSQRTLSLFPSHQTIRLVDPETPRGPEPKSRPVSGTVLSPARYEPPSKVQKPSRASGLKRLGSLRDQTPSGPKRLGSLRGQTQSREPRRISGPILPPTRYEPPAPSKQHKSQPVSEPNSTLCTPTTRRPLASASDSSPNDRPSPVDVLPHLGHIHSLETFKGPWVSPMQQAHASDRLDEGRRAQLPPSQNEFAAPSDPTFFEQEESPSRSKPRNVAAKASSKAPPEPIRVPPREQGLSSAYQQSLPPWTQPYAPPHQATSESPNQRPSPHLQPPNSARSFPPDNVHYPSWSEISEFDFTGDGSSPVRFLRPQRSFGQLVSSKVREIEERVELLGSLPAGHRSGSLHSASNPTSPRSAISPSHAL